jgi:non-canonical poly(A) RNA polymerase PAPD5/7
MGDSYRPGGGGGDGRNRYQAQDYERNYRPQQYDSYPPPQRHYDSRPPPGGSSYRPPGPPPSSFHGNSRDSDRGGFTFRGAAGGQSYRPEQNFTFDAPGPRAPNGFAPDNAPRERPRRFDRDNGRPRHAGRGSGAPRGRGRGGFGPKPAHDRAILSKMAGSRETTPEQFEGMNDGHSHFKEVADSSEGDDSDDEGPRKRTKVEASEAPAAPKWSNPDPYTVLPPPESLGAPKKDIVQTIRKAKNEQLAKVDKVADNSDFISFNFDDDDDAKSDPPSPPVTKSPAQSGEPSFSHRDSFHRKTSTSNIPQSNGASTASFTPINQRTQAPVSISSDSDHAEVKSIVPERVSRPPKRKSRDTRQFGDVVEEWQSVDGQPVAPWCTRDHSATASVGLR